MANVEVTAAIDNEDSQCGGWVWRGEDIRCRPTLHCTCCLSYSALVMNTRIWAMRTGSVLQYDVHNNYSAYIYI